MSLVNSVGTRDIRYLSGDIDNDRFLTKNDLGESHYDLLMNCYHQGQCDDDVSEASKYFEIKDYDKAREYLSNTGLYHDFLNEDDEIDEEKILEYYLWVLSGDIQDTE